MGAFIGLMIFGILDIIVGIYFLNSGSGTKDTKFAIYVIITGSIIILLELTVMLPNLLAN